MFVSLEDAREFATRMAAKYRCTWYIVCNKEGYEPIGPLDMYYGLLQTAIKVQA